MPRIIVFPKRKPGGHKYTPYKGRNGFRCTICGLAKSYCRRPHPPGSGIHIKVFIIRDPRKRGTWQIIQNAEFARQVAKVNGLRLYVGIATGFTIDKGGRK